MQHPDCFTEYHIENGRKGGRDPPTVAHIPWSRRDWKKSLD